MAHTRKNDIRIRYGGDEFLIIFKDLEINHAKMHASLIYNNLLTNTEKISISYGVIAMNVSLAKTIINVDKDMYKMKANIKQNAIDKIIDC